MQAPLLWWRSTTPRRSPTPSPAPACQSIRRPERAVDRLVRRLREADVGRVNHPIFDRHLDYDMDSAVPWMTFDARSDVAAAQLLRRLCRRRPGQATTCRFATVVEARRQLAAVLRRWAYFERRDNGWRDMLPYTSVSLLEAVINATGAEERAARAAACATASSRPSAWRKG
jgi:hypothetical protein